MLKRPTIAMLLALLMAVSVAGCAKKTEQAKSAAPSVSGDAPPSATPATPFADAAEPRSYIHEGRFLADVMAPVAPPRMAELAARLQEAAKANPEWFREQVKQSRPGEPLPYDPRMGLSQAEYSDFIAMSGQMTMEKQGEGEISIIPMGDGVFTIDGGPRMPDLKGVEIDFARQEVRTPHGVAKEQAPVNASAGSALGAWNGVEWKMTRLNPKTKTGATVKFALGTLQPSGRSVIYYNVTKLDPAGNARILLVLNYDAAARL